MFTQDEIGQSSFSLRSEYLAMMLGVQRHIVAEPMAALQSIGAIGYDDERVTVLSQRKLRGTVCECYVAPIDYAKRLATSARRRKAR